MSNNIFLRRSGLGLDSIRNVKKAMTNPSSIFRVDLGRRSPSNYSYAINWGVTNLSYDIPEDKLLNTPSAVLHTSKKGKFRKELYMAQLSPFTTLSVAEACDRVSIETPLIIRPSSHFGGRNLVFADSVDKVRAAFNMFGSGAYATTYFPKTNEYRVFVANGRVVYVVEKIVDDSTAVAWNVHQGGRFVNVPFSKWKPIVVLNALRAMNLTELDFGAVDVMYGNSEAHVLEINTAPSLSSEYWVTCVAKTFDYIITNGKEKLPTVDNKGYKGYIHPAISDKAILAEPTREVRRSKRYVLDSNKLLLLEEDYYVDDTPELKETISSTLVLTLHEGFSLDNIDDIIVELAKFRTTSI